MSGDTLTAVEHSARRLRVLLALSVLVTMGLFGLGVTMLVAYVLYGGGAHLFIGAADVSVGGLLLSVHFHYIGVASCKRRARREGQP